MYETSRAPRIKMGIVCLCLFLGFSMIVFRAYQLQILDNTRVENLTQNQREAKLVVSPRRGAIYDRQGEILALDVLVSSVGIHPHLIKDSQKVKDLLLKNTNVDSVLLDQKLQSEKKFEFVERRIPWQAGRTIEQQKLEGVQVVNEYRRYYPNKSLAGQLLGAVGYDAKALGGVELSLDDYLLVAPEKQKVFRDARGKTFSRIDTKEASYDLYLTIDKDVQHFAEETLSEYGQKHLAQNGFAIVADVKTGEILALANYPAFNPNLYWKYPPAQWKNHAITDEYEPGSAFKTISMAAGLQTAKVKPLDRFFCENGNYTIGVNTIHDHIPYGWLTARDILKVSSNIGITKIVQKVGGKDFYETMKSLGYGGPSELGLIGETLGRIRPYKSWRDIEMSNMAFGQGLSVSGLQMVRAYTAIANGGTLFPLSIVTQIVNNAGEVVYKNVPTAAQHPLSPEVAEELRGMLFQVTQPGGTARPANVEGYLAGGKTGTAQKFNTVSGTYENNDYVSSFIGFTPLAEPRYVICVVFDRPRNGYYGGVVAAPAFKKIAEKTLAHFGLAPPIDAPQDTAVLTQAKQISFVTLNEVALDKTQDLLLLPDLRGLSARKALVLAQDRRFQVKLEGSGIVLDQMPQAGSPITNDTVVTLRLAAR